ncbi:VOC family protein [Collimonas pratensis]|nr:VOC family protein [Collimonas pratensis]
MMTKTADMPVPCWLYYINVEAIDAAVERVNAGGGKIIMGPHQVPGGSWIVQGFDPQGAVFSLVAAKR